MESITVDSPTKLTIKLKTPIAGQFYNLLAHGETFVVSPTAVTSGMPLDEKPVGAGPFLLDSYTPEGKAVFKKNPNYFEKNKIKLDRGRADPDDPGGRRPAGADQLAARRHHQRRADGRTERDRGAHEWRARSST